MEMNVELIKRKSKGNITIELVKENELYVVYYIECGECLSSVSNKSLSQATNEYNDIILEK